MLVRPDNPLLTKFVGPREADVLRAVWHTGGSTAQQIHDRVRQDAEAIDGDTVRVHLHRLVKRGLLARQQTGLAYHYQPVAPDERAFAQQQIARILVAIAGDYPDELRAAVAEVLDGR